MNIKNFFETYFKPLCHAKCKQEIKSSIELLSQQLHEFQENNEKSHDHLKHKIGILKRDIESKIAKNARICEDKSNKFLQKSIENTTAS